ncbi:Thioredoxin family protein [Histomonas meleagridis]|uniref:Thioredoxin family protein n=1 Tax=Histomonas meleagridis TaxID=135588 RepID=UPI003559A4B1|nr:Thioredoxin family protein [Histomonas meleagridis]KAH0799247.1 Thioredoxin family protein [Histomonas meleagridis]
MLYLLLPLCLTKIIELNEQKFNKEMKDKKNKNRVWVLLFYTPYCKRFKEIYSALEYAKILTNGSVGYATINCQGEQRLCNSYKITNHPTIIIQNRTTHDEYTDSINPTTIAKAAMEYITSASVKVVDDFWIDDYNEKPTSILFTKKENVPGYFKALSRSFPPSKLRFGICNDEGLFSDYNITKTPTIAFYNNEVTVFHEGPRKLRYLKETANAFLSGRESKSPTRADFYFNTEFPEVCYDYTVTCVFGYESFVDPKYDKIRIQLKNDKFKFFVGDKNIPFTNLKLERGNFVVYNAKKNAAFIVGNVDELMPALDRVLDGTAKWNTLGKYEYSLEL